MGRSKFTYGLMMRFYKFFQRIENWPVIRSEDSEENTSGHIIPVNAVVRAGDSIVLPMSVIEPMIDQAECVCIMSECLCRSGEQCRVYPKETGCLLLGSAARDLDPGLGQMATKEDALAHAERAMQTGLLPLVVHNAFDAWLWGIDYRRMVTVCFCCECCCSVRRGVSLRQSEGFFQNIHRLPGLTVAAGENCIGCGICRDICFAGAIKMNRGRAEIDEGACKGCGRCVHTCPEKNILMTLEPGMDIGADLVEIYGRRSGFRGT